MRYKITPKPRPKIGDRRSICKFLFFPKLLDDEWRWLEFADIVQEYGKMMVCHVEMKPYHTLEWYDVGWEQEIPTRG
jgi:hypothetical protein